MPTKLLLVAGMLAFAVAAAHGALYKWVDEKGRVQYSDKPPTGKDKGGVEMTNRGIVVKKFDGGITPEQKKSKDDEIARNKAEELKAAEQRRQDNALLQSFTSVQEIDMKRDREVQSLEAMILNLRGQERTVSERMLEEQKRAESFAQRKKPLPDSIKDDLTRAQTEKKVLSDEIARRQQEVGDTLSKYDVLKKRYVELRQDGKTGAIQPATPAPPVAAKK